MTKWPRSAHRIKALLFIIAVAFLIDVHTVLGAPEVQGSIAVVAGYRVDSLDWNIAGDDSGLNPNVLSELTWSDLQIYQFGLLGTAENIATKFKVFSPYLLAAVGCGQIVSGKNQDSDYRGDNRTHEFSRSNNHADSGTVFDLSLAGGGKVHLGDSRYTLAPLLGFSYYAQNLTMNDGYQTISDAPSSLGPIAGLNSTYDTAWYGPWLGLDATAFLSRAWTLNAGIEFHRLYYQAKANWNLRSDLAHPKSFEHEGNGYGMIFHLGSAYALTSRLKLTVAADLRRFSIRDGIDRIFSTDGQMGTSRLNEVNWQSQLLTAGLLYNF